MKKISIIIPIYNVEKYIRSCLESLFQQDLDESDFEVILVNDGTKDNSMERISDIIKAHQNIITINQKNKGLSIARNIGIKKASGEYILFVDSDDLLISHRLKRLVQEAIISKADMIIADYIRMTDEEINLPQNQSTVDNNFEIKESTGKELFLKELDPNQCYVWRSLYRTAFLRENGIIFIPKICYEDVPFTHECYLKAEKCIRLSYLFYIYRIGHPSITSGVTLKKGMDYCNAIVRTWELSYLRNLSSDIIKKIKDDVFVSISALIYILVHEKRITYEEKVMIIRYLKQVCPDLHFNNGAKQRIFNFLYHCVPMIYLRIRLIFVKINLP